MPSQAKVRLGRNIPSKLIWGNCFTLLFREGDKLLQSSRGCIQGVSINPGRGAAPARVAGAFLLLGILLLGRGSMKAGGAAREPHCWKMSPAEIRPGCLLQRIAFKYISLKRFSFINLRGWFIKANFLLRMKHRIMFLVSISKEDLHFIHTIKVLLMETSQ